MNPYNDLSAPDLLALAAHDSEARAEVLRRLRPPDRPAFRCSAEVAPFLARKVKGKVERFAVVSLDSRNRAIGVDVVSQGAVGSTIVHPREVFSTAIRRNAVAIIIGHNHPSGDPTPSPEDIALTSRLADAGKLLGIPVLDHVIIGNPDYFSLRDHGQIGGVQ